MSLIYEIVLIIAACILGICIGTIGYSALHDPSSSFDGTIIYDETFDECYLDIGEHEILRTKPHIRLKIKKIAK